MKILLNRGWIVLALMLALPFLLLGSAHLTSRSGGGEAAFLLLLFCILSIYVSLAVGAAVFAGVGALWLLSAIKVERSMLIRLLLLSAMNMVASIVWLRVFVQHLRFRY
jgi:hypothetical protein